METTTDVLRKHMREERGFHAPKLYPSAAGMSYRCPYIGIDIRVGGCRKAEFLKFIAMSYPNVLPERQVDQSVEMKAAMGEVLHESVRICHEKNGTLIGNEIRFNWPEMFLGGRIDNVVIDATTMKMRILEVKTKTIYLKPVLITPDRNTRHEPDGGALAQAITYYLFFMAKVKGASDEQILELVSYKDAKGAKTFCESSRQALIKVRDYINEKGDIRTLEVFYISRDDLDCASHLIHVYEDGKLALMNSVHQVPIMLNANVETVASFFQDIIDALKVFESHLDKFRKNAKDGTRITVDKFLDILKACTPPDDFVDCYDQDRIALMYKAGLLTKTDEEKFAKGNKLTKKYGDKQCEYCDFYQYCKGVQE